MANKVLILGCGWAGKHIAQLLIQQQYQCFASTTRSSGIEPLRALGATAFLANFSGSPDQWMRSLEELKEHTFELVLISVPVSRKETASHTAEKFTNLRSFLSAITCRSIVYLSSTGIYSPAEGILCEESELQASSALHDMEQRLSKHFRRLYILRLGGLFGFDRIPGKYFSGSSTSRGDEKSNYIHVSDLSEIVLKILTVQPQYGIYNVVAPNHPLKKDVYEAMIRKYGLSPITYLESGNLQREISSRKLTNALSYNFKYPDPAQF